jgi:hypothetical protein
MAAVSLAQFKFTPFDVINPRPSGVDTSETFATGISADGKKISGKQMNWFPSGHPLFGSQTYAALYSNTNGTWSMSLLGDINSTGTRAASSAKAISGDGTRLIGWTSDGPAIFNPNSVLPKYPVGVNYVTDVVGINQDASELIGTGHGSYTDNPNDPFYDYFYRWSTTYGTVLIAPLNGSGKPTGISPDGSIFFGWSEDPNPDEFHNQAFYYRYGDGYHVLPLPNAFKHTYPAAMSADNSTIVGYGSEPSLSNPYPFYYREGVGTVPVVGPAGRPMGKFFATNSTGTVIVGMAYDYGVPGHPILWTPQTGVLDLVEYLVANGVNLGDYDLREATGVSADGRFICGNGYRVNANGDTENVGWVVQIQIPQGLAGFSLSANETPGGKVVRGTVTLARTATANETVTLSSSDSVLASVPATVTIPAGSKSAGFNITTKGVASDSAVTLTASLGVAVHTQTLTLKPAKLSAFKVTYPGAPDPLDAGKPATGVITLDGNAPAGGLAVKVWDNGAVILLPSTEAEAVDVVVPEGESSYRFTIETKASANPGTKNVYAKQGGATITAPVPLRAWYAVSSVSVSPSVLQSGGSATATVTINLPARTGGEFVAVVLGPSLQGSTGVVIPAGAKSATFAVSAHAVSSNVSSYVKASLGGKSVQASVSIKAPVLKAVTMPTSFTGGQTVAVTVELTGVAQSDITISLRDSTDFLATPASVVVPAGSSSVTFNVTSSAVTTAQVDKSLIASYAGVSKRATFTINP